jgi:LacI family transcriptional regulator
MPKKKGRYSVRGARRPQPKVALMIESSNCYGRGIIRGVISYMREHRPWLIFFSEHRRGEPAPAWFAGWRGDGLIARIENEEVARVVRSLSIPIVDVSAARLVPSLPWVETDDEGIARLAAEHLLRCGLRQFGVCGDSRFNWANWRCGAFARLIGEAGYPCEVYRPRPHETADSEAQFKHIADWIAGLPKPAGVFAHYDFRGRQILDACKRRHIAVPDDLAVLSVDNEDLICELTDPPLSSVILNPQRTGYEAARLLDRMMSGESVALDKHAIPPLGIATRQSTDMLAIEDPDVADAVRFIRDHACEGIDVKDILDALPQSRRLLEGRFKKLLGRSPHDEIVRVRLARVKSLLVETQLTVQKVARLTGFKYVEHLSRLFREEFGMTPSQYRATSRYGKL